KAPYLAPKAERRFHWNRRFSWSGWRDSNPRSLRPERIQNPRVRPGAPYLTWGYLFLGVTGRPTMSRGVYIPAVHGSARSAGAGRPVRGERSGPVTISVQPYSILAAQRRTPNHLHRSGPALSMTVRP